MTSVRSWFCSFGRHSVPPGRGAGVEHSPYDVELRWLAVQRLVAPVPQIARDEDLVFTLNRMNSVQLN